jgi:hypothetical protein
VVLKYGVDFRLCDAAKFCQSPVQATDGNLLATFVGKEQAASSPLPWRTIILLFFGLTTIPEKVNAHNSLILKPV